jgi:hypothetical protein
MSYATIAQVKSLFRDFADNADAAVTDAEITEFLDSTEAAINAKLSTLYTLPLTDADSLLIVGKVEKYLVAGIVDDILNNYSEADKKPDWHKRGKELLTELVPKRNAKGVQPEPTMKLPGESFLGTSRQRSRIKVSNSSGTIFQKGEDNW